jgi:hypothetical protein
MSAAQAIIGRRPRPCCSPAVHCRPGDPDDGRLFALDRRDDDGRNPRPPVRCGDEPVLSLEVDRRRAPAVQSSGLGAITDNARQAWGTLNPRFRRMFERYGLGENDWNTIRSTPLEEDGGAQWILPKNIPDPAWRSACRDDPDRERVRGSDVSLRIRSAVNARFHKGSIPGEIGRSFCCSAASRCSCSGCTGAGCLRREGKDGLEYAATLFITSTVMGMLAYQLKQIVAGKDPVNMDPHENPASRQGCVPGRRARHHGRLHQFRDEPLGQARWRRNLGPVGEHGRRPSRLRRRSVTTAGRARRPEQSRQGLRQLIQNNTSRLDAVVCPPRLQPRGSRQASGRDRPDYYESLRPHGEAGAAGSHAYWWRPGKGLPIARPT